MSRWSRLDRGLRSSMRVCICEVMVMEVVLIVGIVRRFFDEFLRNFYWIIEFRSVRNVFVVERVMEDLRRLFLMYELFEDVRIGIEGLIIELIEVREFNMRVLWEESDEREVIVCRVRVKFFGFGRVVEMERRDFIIVVKVREMFL